MQADRNRMHTHRAPRLGCPAGAQVINVDRVFDYQACSVRSCAFLHHSFEHWRGPIRRQDTPARQRCARLLDHVPTRYFCEELLVYFNAACLCHRVIYVKIWNSPGKRALPNRFPARPTIHRCDAYGQLIGGMSPVTGGRNMPGDYCLGSN